MQTLRSLFVVAVLFVSGACLAQENNLYQYDRVGNPLDVVKPTTPGFALMGGGDDLDEAFQWMCERSGGGDFLILRAAGSDAYNEYVHKLCHGNSVATLVVPTRKAACDPFVTGQIQKAEAIFIAGGDQANYIRNWRGTAMGTALNEAIARKVPIGGTSAGLAVLGEFIYSAEGDQPNDPNLSSQLALSDPMGPRVRVVTDFLKISSLKATVTDTHFVARDRLGRLLVFMARVRAQNQAMVKGIGVEERSAVLVDADGSGKVVGKGSAYFFKTTAPVELKAGTPLTLGKVSVSKLSPGETFDLHGWTGGKTHYELSVTAGKLQSTQAGGAIY